MQQSWHADVACGEAAATGPFDERATEEALADPGGTDQDQVVAFGDPGAGAEGQDLLAVEPARVGEVDGLEGGRMAQLGGAEPPLQFALLAGRPLGVDEQAEAFLEAERGGLVGLDLLLAGVGHRGKSNASQTRSATCPRLSTPCETAPSRTSRSRARSPRRLRPT